MINRFKEIKNFPKPASDKKGWPWVDSFENPPFNYFSKNHIWPKISVVTPSFNQGRYLEETIRSVLLQDYPNFEYIVIDGGSNDNSLDIIKKYQPWITYWVSEKDYGQAHAINKGLEKSTGEIFNWINSDDILLKDAFKIISENFGNSEILAGSVINFNENSYNIIKQKNLSLKKMIRGDQDVIYQQPGTWIKTLNLKKMGGLDLNLDYCFDWYMMLYYLKDFQKIKYINHNLAKFRLHPLSKTVNMGNEFRREMLFISYKIMYEENFPEMFRLDAIKSIHRFLWLENLDRLKNKKYHIIKLINQIFSTIFWNLFSYPYRYSLGILKDYLLKYLKNKFRLF